MPDPSRSPVPSALDALDPDAVARRDFTLVKRGYEPREVPEYLLRVGSELAELLRENGALREREADLLAALDDAERRAAQAGELDASQLTAMVGEETARVLDAARFAANEIRAHAEADGRDIVAEAREAARAIRADAEQILLHRTREADDAVAERLLSAAATVQQADAEAEAILTRAQDDAAAARVVATTQVELLLEEAQARAVEIVGNAEQRGTELVREAELVRERLLGDLARRRKLMRSQVEQLQAGRDRLVQAYAVVRATLDSATEELDIALPEARSAAQAAVRSVEEADDPTLVEAFQEIGAEVDAPAPPDAHPVADADAEPTAPTDEVVAVDVDAAVEPTAPTDVAVDEVVDAAVAVDGAVDAAVEAEVAEEIVAAESAVEVAELPPPPRTKAPTARGRGRARAANGRRAPDPVEHEGRHSSSVRVIAPSTAAPVDTDASTDVGAADGDGGADPGPDVHEDPRTVAVGAATRSACRKLQRVLADHGNAWLDATRRARRALPGLDDLTVDEELGDLLVDAASGGLRNAAEAAAAQVGAAAVPDIEDLAVGLARHLTASLDAAAAEALDRATTAQEAARADGARAGDALEAARDLLLDALRRATRQQRGRALTDLVDAAAGEAWDRGTQA